MTEIFIAYCRILDPWPASLPPGCSVLKQIDVFQVDDFLRRMSRLGVAHALIKSPGCQSSVLSPTGGLSHLPQIQVHIFPFSASLLSPQFTYQCFDKHLKQLTYFLCVKHRLWPRGDALAGRSELLP